MARALRALGEVIQSTLELKVHQQLDRSGPTRAAGVRLHELARAGRLCGRDDRVSDVLYLSSNIEPPMVNPWIIQDGPYWRSRAEMLRRTADETDAFRPETRARMLRIAQGYDVLAKRVEQRAKDDKASRRSSQRAPSIRQSRDRVTRTTTSG